MSDKPEITLQRVTSDDMCWTIAKRFAQLYLHELSGYRGQLPSVDGVFDDSFLDYKEKLLFLVVLNTPEAKKYVGFFLMKHEMGEGGTPYSTMEDGFVLAEFRERKFVPHFLSAAQDMYPGLWQGFVCKENKRSLKIMREFLQEPCVEASKEHEQENHIRLTWASRRSGEQSEVPFLPHPDVWLY